MKIRKVTHTERVFNAALEKRDTEEPLAHRADCDIHAPAHATDILAPSHTHPPSPQESMSWRQYTLQTRVQENGMPSMSRIKAGSGGVDGSGGGGCVVVVVVLWAVVGVTVVVIARAPRL